jgi:hypothetical protein
LTSSDSSLGAEDVEARQNDFFGEEPFGDFITTKQDNILRIGFQNIGGFPKNRTKFKEEIIRQGLCKWEFNVFSMAEMNLDWRMCQEVNKIPFRTKEWWEHQHVSWSHNTTSPPLKAHQFGGTALFSVNHAAHRVIAKGWDPSKLSRWSWTRYRGRSDHTLRIISAYHPNPPTPGPFTVYAQHNALFNSQNKPRCPRATFLEDLKEELQGFLAEGDHIILMLDGNCNMKQSDLVEMLSSLLFSELLLTRHGYDSPSTFKRNTQHIPIDRIWGTPGIDIKAGGYFQFDEVFVNTDHRCLWMDITFINAFGHSMPPLFRPKARRLHCKDPRLIDIFTYLCHKYANKYQLFSQVRNFEKNIRQLASVSSSI